MGDSFQFILNSFLLGTGLAMDAFSVSVANGLYNPEMKKKDRAFMSGVYAFFQCIMPLIGWFCVHSISRRFEAFNRLVPVIALVLLAFIGGKMLLEGITHKGENDGAIESKDDNVAKSAEKESAQRVGMTLLIFQGIATSIDALSVGFAIADYKVAAALICALIIAAVTFILCMVGVNLGRKFGTILGSYAEIFGGLILIAIGIRIFVA